MILYITLKMSSSIIIIGGAIYAIVTLLQKIKSLRNYNYDNTYTIQ